MPCSLRRSRWSRVRINARRLPGRRHARATPSNSRPRLCGVNSAHPAVSLVRTQNCVNTKNRSRSRRSGAGKTKSRKRKAQNGEPGAGGAERHGVRCGCAAFNFQVPSSPCDLCAFLRPFLQGRVRLPGGPYGNDTGRAARPAVAPYPRNGRDRPMGCPQGCMGFSTARPSVAPYLS